MGNNSLMDNSHIAFYPNGTEAHVKRLMTEFNSKTGDSWNPQNRIIEINPDGSGTYHTVYAQKRGGAFVIDEPISGELKFKPDTEYFLHMGVTSRSQIQYNETGIISKENIEILKTHPGSVFDGQTYIKNN